MATLCRDATLNDLEDINVLQQSTSKGSPFSNRQEIVFKRLITESMTHLIVVEKDLYVVGMCQLSIIPTLSEGGRSLAVIGNAIIDPLNRRQGLAKFLLKHAVQKARKAGCFQITASINTPKPWQTKLLEELGFKLHNGSFTIS